MKTFILKCFDEQHFLDSTLSFESKNNEAMLELVVGDLVFKGADVYPFIALRQIRLELEKRNFKLLCNGARKNVHPSGFGLIFHKAYVLKLEKPASKDDLVPIFEPTELIEDIATVEEQESFYLQWLNSNNFFESKPTTK